VRVVPRPSMNASVSETMELSIDLRPEEGVMRASSQFDCAGRRRSPATLPGFHRGRVPRNKGLRYPADPPTVDEWPSCMRQEMARTGSGSER
jgi:hypothetical protein